jgi:hypothetical protein
MDLKQYQPNIGEAATTIIEADMVCIQIFRRQGLGSVVFKKRRIVWESNIGNGGYKSSP